MIFFLFIYLHCCTCFWWQVVFFDKKWICMLHLNSDDLYQLYSKDWSVQYIYCLHSSILVCLGTDIGPRGAIQAILGAWGVFFGTFINANIFGELALILSELNRLENSFQGKIALANTTMINLNLPFDIQ